MKQHLAALPGVGSTSTALIRPQGLRAGNLGGHRGVGSSTQGIIWLCTVLLSKHLSSSGRAVGFSTYFSLAPALPASSACRRLHRRLGSPAGHCEPAVHSPGPSAPAGKCAAFVCNETGNSLLSNIESSSTTQTEPPQTAAPHSDQQSRKGTLQLRAHLKRNNRKGKHFGFLQFLLTFLPFSPFKIFPPIDETHKPRMFWRIQLGCGA